MNTSQGPGIKLKMGGTGIVIPPGSLKPGDVLHIRSGSAPQEVAQEAHEGTPQTMETPKDS